jgi:hypothetical protein
MPDAAMPNAAMPNADEGAAGSLRAAMGWRYSGIPGIPAFSRMPRCLASIH